MIVVALPLSQSNTKPSECLPNVSVLKPPHTTIMLELIGDAIQFRRPFSEFTTICDQIYATGSNLSISLIGLFPFLPPKT